MKSSVNPSYVVLVSVFILVLSVAGFYMAAQETGEETTLEDEALQCYNNSVENNSVNDWNNSNYSEYYDEELKACLDPTQDENNRS